MHDYQLERLNTRSFEQLVQALAIAGFEVGVVNPRRIKPSAKPKAKEPRPIDWTRVSLRASLWP